MTLDELQTAVLQWSYDRGITSNATLESQLLKAMSEMGELADAVAKSQFDEMRDAIGDVTVCLINLAYLSGSSLRECLEGAWEEIKDRRGILLPNGVFVKEVTAMQGMWASQCYNFGKPVPVLAVECADDLIAELQKKEVQG